MSSFLKRESPVCLAGTDQDPADACPTGRGCKGGVALTQVCHLISTVKSIKSTHQGSLSHAFIFFCFVLGSSVGLSFQELQLKSIKWCMSSLSFSLPLLLLFLSSKVHNGLYKLSILRFSQLDCCIPPPSAPQLRSRIPVTSVKWIWGKINSRAEQLIQLIVCVFPWLVAR